LEEKYIEIPQSINLLAKKAMALIEFTQVGYQFPELLAILPSKLDKKKR